MSTQATYLISSTLLRGQSHTVPEMAYGAVDIHVCIVQAEYKLLITSLQTFMNIINLSYLTKTFCIELSSSKSLFMFRSLHLSDFYTKLSLLSNNCDCQVALDWTMAGGRDFTTNPS